MNVSDGVTKAAGASRVIVITGVSGSGKSTVGRLLARRLDWPFLAAMVTVLLVYSLLEGGLLAWNADEVARKAPQSSVASAPPLDDSTLVTIDRGPCLGMCPEYSLALYGSGRVEFEGRRHVCAKGRHTATTDPVAVRALVARLIAARYFDLMWKEGPLATDATTVTTSFRHDGRLRTIRHYHGDHGAPRLLAQIEDRIDAVAGSARWLPERKDHRPVCHRADGTLETVED